MATFGAFTLLFSLMMFLVGFSACAIGVSAWPFVVPIVLTFFTTIDDGPDLMLFDALYIAVLVDLVNALVLTGLAVRSKSLHIKEGVYYGAIASLPALPSAILATRYLGTFEELLKEVSGYGLFFFGLIFAIRGVRMHQRQLAKAAAADDSEVDPLVRRGSSFEVTADAPDSDRRHSITQVSRRSSSSHGLPEDAPRRATERYKLVLCALTLGLAGVFAGFVGFGNGMLFATAYIIFMDMEIAEAAGTAMLSTSILMAVVALCYIPEFRPLVLGRYLGVTIGASLLGVVAGHTMSRYNGGINPLVVNFFVAAVLCMCGIVASLPTWVNLD